MPQNNSKPQREYRQKGAESRQKRYDALSVQEKLEQAQGRPGASKREVSRLEAAA